MTWEITEVRLAPVIFSQGAWAMDGFQNIIVRGLGFQSVLKPAGILLLFAMGFLISSLIVFQVERRKYL